MRVAPDPTLSTTSNIILNLNVIEAKMAWEKKKNEGYNWKVLIPGWIAVLTTMSIFVTKHVLASETVPNLAPPSFSAQTIIEILYPGAFMHLIGTIAGVTTDVTAVLKNGPSYFKEGHNEYHQDLLPDNSCTIAWGIAWGVHTTWRWSTVAMMIETILSACLTLFANPIPFTYISYMLSGALLLGVVLTHLVSDYKIKSLVKYVGSNLNKMLTEEFKTVLINEKSGCEVNLNKIPFDQRLGWYNTNEMTQFAWKFFPIVGVLTAASSAALGIKPDLIPGLR